MAFFKIICPINRVCSNIEIICDTSKTLSWFYFILNYFFCTRNISTIINEGCIYVKIWIFWLYKHVSIPNCFTISKIRANNRGFIDISSIKFRCWCLIDKTWKSWVYRKHCYSYKWNYRYTFSPWSSCTSIQAMLQYTRMSLNAGF